MSAEPAIAVSDNPEQQRYEVRVDGDVAGFINGYIQRHREYVDLVPEDRRTEFDL